jgi:hypothetical protein
VLTDLRTPGVYYQAADAGGPEVTPLRTDIAAFAGIAERGPIDLPVPVQSWRQFASWFGDVVPTGYLGHAVRAFFENGGVRCWVVRVASQDPAAGAVAAAVVLNDADGPAWILRASSEGAWGNRLSVAVREVNRVQVIGTTTDPDGLFTAVTSVAGLARDTHVLVTQPGRAPIWKVVAGVDPGLGRVLWRDPQGRNRPWETPLAGVDPALPVVVRSIEYRVLVSESDRLVASYDALSLVPSNARYGPDVLAPVQAPVDPLTRMATWTPPAAIVVDDVRGERPWPLPGVAPTGLLVDPDARSPLTGGRSGLSPLEPRDFYGEPVGPGDGPEATAFKRRGIRTLEEIAEVGLLAVPDAVVHPEPPRQTAPQVRCVPDPCLDDPYAAPRPAAPIVEGDEDLPPVFAAEQVYAVQAQMVLQCESLRYRFALLDPPQEAALDPAEGLTRALAWRARFDTPFAALIYPWLVVPDPLGPAGAGRVVPASGHVAGGYAATDLAVGVHRAGANRPVAWALAASAEVDATRQGVLNDAGVDVLRAVGSRGLRLLGARTLSSDPDWRFVPVRRLMSMVEKALDIALQWVVFEPDGVLTRARVTLTVTSFLLGLHEAGMLAGATVEESFYVQCDLDNNPPGRTDLGELVVEIGIAPVQPMEFVVVRVGRVSDSLQVREQGPRTPAGGVA